MATRINQKCDINIDQRVDKLGYMREWRRLRRSHYNEWSKDYRQRTPEKQLLRRAKARAKKHGLPFDITEEDIIIPEYCPILGIKLKFCNEKRSYSPSIDKIIPEKGYVKGNISVISNRANTIKSNMTLEEIIRMSEWAKSQ